MKSIDLVQTNPLPGQEEEFNEWYSGRHSATSWPCRAS